MAAPVPALPEVIRDGRWLAHRYDDSDDSIQFRLIPRDAQREMTFLTNCEVASSPIAVFSRAECLSEVRGLELQTPRFIFHSAYCCSTLLARAFDLPGTSFGLKEPQILNDVVGLQLRGGDPRQVAAAMDIALLLLARPLAAGEVNVVKPSTLTNPHISLVIALRPEVRGLLLHAPLDVFLTSVARKEVEGRAWVRELMWGLIQLGQAERFGFTTEELYRQTDLQVAALGWLSQHAIFSEAAERHSAFRSIDSEALMARPLDALLALKEAFAIDYDAEVAVSGPAFRTHSKDRSEFSPERRQKEREAGSLLHAREVGIVLEWAQKVAEYAGVPMRLPRQLIT